MSTEKKPAQPAATEKKVPTVKVKLKKAHSHAGQHYEAGAEIEVSEKTRAWLAARGVI